MALSTHTDVSCFTTAQMFKPTRIIASVVLILSIALIFVGAFVLDSAVCVSCMVRSPQAYSSVSFSSHQALCISEFQIDYARNMHLIRVCSLRHHSIPRVHMVHAVIRPLRTVCRQRSFQLHLLVVKASHDSSAVRQIENGKRLGETETIAMLSCWVCCVPYRINVMFHFQPLRRTPPIRVWSET